MSSDPEEIDERLRTECILCGQIIASNAFHQHVPEECDAL